MNIIFQANRIDDGRIVRGNYFTTPLTDENSGCEQKDGLFFLSDGETRHCIESEGCVYVINPETLTLKVKIEE